MDEGLVIEGISFLGRCGVTREERTTLQPLLVDLEFACSAADAIQTDTLSKTIDYAQVAERVVDVGRAQECALLETLADRISRTLLAEFPIQTLRIWLRKAQPPLHHVTGTVGVRLTYHRSQQEVNVSASRSPCSSFFITHAKRIPRGKVLDLACGTGRHALQLAKQGYEVVGVDRNLDALETLQEAGRSQNLTNLSVRAWDLEGEKTPDLGNNEFAGIIVFFYLYRPLFPNIIAALKPGGLLLYETFLMDNHNLFQHPRRKEFCLERNELLQLSQGLRILHYEEGKHQDQLEQLPAYTARIVAQKPGEG